MSEPSNDTVRDLETSARSVGLALERLPSVDAVHERLAGLLSSDEMEIVLLGQAQDSTPIIMAGAGDGPRTLLVIGASPGDGPLSALAALLALEHHADLPGWRVWVIPCLDAARMRLNEGALSVAPKVDEHVFVRRSPWGPGEDPEQNVPIDHAPLWQPDTAPDDAVEGFVASSPEQVAVTRAIHHLKPDLVVSIAERLAGGVSIAADRDLENDDIASILRSVCGDLLPIHHGAKWRPGRQPNGKEGFVVLPDLAEDYLRTKTLGLEPGARLTGGHGSWQALEAANPAGVYVGLDLPRFTGADLGDESQSDLTMAVSTRVEDRQRNGKTSPHLVINIIASDLAWDGAELRSDPVSNPDGAALGEFDGLPALHAWVAVEALLRRADAVTRALDVLQVAAPSCRHDDIQRSLQLLRADDSVDRIKTYQNNKRYARRATVAQVAWWTTCLPVTTSALVAEARHGLEVEDSRDAVISGALQALDEIVAEQTSSGDDLNHVAPGELLAAALRGVAASCAAVQTGGPTLVRAKDTVDRLSKAATAARRAVRDAKNLQSPRADVREAEQHQNKAEEELRAATEVLQALSAPDVETAESSDADRREDDRQTDAPATEDEQGDAADPPAADVGAAEAIASDTVGALEVPDGEHEAQDGDDRTAADVPARGDDDRSPVDAEGDPPDPPRSQAQGQAVDEAHVETIPDPFAVADPQPQVGTDLEPLGERGVAESDDSAQDVAVLEPRPGKEIVPAGPSLEETLPSQIRMQPEWGAGPMDWDRQQPRFDDRPLRVFVEQDDASSEGTEPHAVDTSEQSPPAVVVGVELSPVSADALLPSPLQAKAQPFLRQRGPLYPPRPSAPLRPLAPAPVTTTAGFYEYRPRRLLKTS